MLKTFAMLGAVLMGAVAAWTVGTDSQAELLEEAVVSFEGARRTALAAVPGGRIVEEEIERENGRLIFSFDVVDQAGVGAMRDVEIDAMTGALIQNVPDDDDDDGEDDDDVDDDR